MNRIYPYFSILRLLGVCMFTMAFSPVASADEGAAVYQVRVSPVVEKDVHEQLHVYGQVGFDDATLENINLPYSGQVIRLPLLAGEPVRKGETIAEIAVDPSVASAYQQALSSVHYAESEVNRIKKCWLTIWRPNRSWLLQTKH